MVRVAVTGAAGNVGRVTLEALNEHDVTPITHSEYDDIDGIVLDVEDRAALDDAFTDRDVVVHLAGDPSPEATWESVLSTNIDGTRNVYEAARSNDVDRVVFASTNHVQQMYNVNDRTRPETARLDSEPVRPDDEFSPDSYYGVSKVAGEALGAYYTHRYDIDIVNLRIGWLLTDRELRERQSGDDAVARYARALWLSPQDCRDGMRCAVEAELSQSPLSVNLCSANHERYFSITETMRGLGYEPTDNSADVVGE